MKFLIVPAAAVSLMVVAGCASTATPGTETKTATKEERCMVTGSNVPKRDCRGDVTILPPSSVETVMPVLPGPANRP